MAWEDFFNHTCDIYHVRASSDSPGWGLPDSNGKYSYGNTPDIAAVRCHFGTHTANSTATISQQTEPRNLLDVRIKLALPIGTDIRINDKVVDCDSGYEFTAEMPRNVQNHHIYVYIKRTEVQKAL